jgi:hypothetical protein
MRALLIALLWLAVATGCAHRKHLDTYSSIQSPVPLNQAALNQRGPDNGTPRLIVTPENQLIGRVAMVNSADRFVVINFPLGRMPLVDQHLNLYRRGLKVGEVKITGPQQDDNIVGDLVSGDSEPGDEARAQ